MAHEVNPFNGKPFFSEVVFCYGASGVMITADFFWNWPDDVPAATRAWKWGMDVVFKWFYFNFMIKDPGAAQFLNISLLCGELMN
jgi:hypothetical protein